MPHELTSTASVMDVLGGTSKVAELTGRTYPAAYNWRSFETFPSDTYVALQAALRAKRKYSAPDSLWGMVPARRRNAAANDNKPRREGQAA
jgi:hypothetical protein